MYIKEIYLLNEALEKVKIKITGLQSNAYLGKRRKLILEDLGDIIEAVQNVPVPHDKR